MRKFIALLAGITLFLLCGCGEAIPAPDPSTGPSTAEPETTAFVPATIAYIPPTTAPWVPNDPPAVMEPVQGGKMLYTFPGKVPYRMEEYDGDEYPIYPIGLINQDGKLVSPAIYHRVDYFYDEGRQRIIGVVAQLDNETTIYWLNGESRVLPCESYRATVCPGGRYAIIEAARPTYLFGDSAWDPQKDGLYDIKKNQYVIEPKLGQLIQYACGGVVLGYQYNHRETPGDTLGEQTAQWIFYCADERVVDFSTLGDRVQEYYPETGWFGGTIPVFDSDLQRIPLTENWSMESGRSGGFNCGEWCRISRYPNYNSWINRKGEMSDKQYASVSRNGTCYLVTNDIEFYSEHILLDANLEEVCREGEGEKMIVLGDGFLLVNKANMQVKKAFDSDGKPFPKTDSFQCWAGGSAAYAVQNGQWSLLNLAQFFPEPKDGHEGAWPFANAIIVCEDYLVVRTGVTWETEDGTIIYDTFAIDWQGNKVQNCPLEPYFDQLYSDYNTASPQGPSYYWVEIPTRRGYISTSGTWLFIDQS